MALHGLIKLIFIDALEGLKDPVAWVDFVDMDKEVFFEIQAQAQLELGEETTTKGST